MKFKRSEQAAEEATSAEYESQPHIKRLLQLLAAGSVPAGRSVLSFVAHDDDCPRLTGGLCECTPDIRTSAVAKWN